MRSFHDARALKGLLRSSRSVDIDGQVIGTVDSPARLVSWANTITHPSVVVGYATDIAQRYVQVTARCVHAGGGRIIAVLDCEDHHEFWYSLAGDDLAPGAENAVAPEALNAALNTARGYGT